MATTGTEAAKAASELATQQAGLDASILEAAKAGTFDPITGKLIGTDALSQVASQGPGAELDALRKAYPGGPGGFEDLLHVDVPMMSPNPEMLPPAFTSGQQAISGKMDSLLEQQAKLQGLQGTGDELTNKLVSLRKGITPTQRMTAPLTNMGAFGKQLLKTGTLAPIAIGEGQREQMRVEEQARENNRRFEREQEEETT